MNLSLKQFKALLTAGALMALAIACRGPDQNETMLRTAGFKMLPATNSLQSAQLNNLPEGKIIKVHRSGTVYYTYPDAPNQVLYVGGQEQYQKYLRLRLGEEMADEQLNYAQDPDSWWIWGPWWPPYESSKPLSVNYRP